MKKGAILFLIFVICFTMVAHGFAVQDTNSSVLPDVLPDETDEGESLESSGGSGALDQDNAGEGQANPDTSELEPIEDTTDTGKSDEEPEDSNDDEGHDEDRENEEEKEEPLLLRNFDKAEIMNTLGLFQGMGTGYHLEHPINRAQAAVMIVRLLGMEQHVLETPYEHPFIDDVPDWASTYVGYLYENGLTNGTSVDRYSPELDIPANQYVTFILRLLGYDDNEGDFYYEDSLETALEIGLINQGEFNDIADRDYFLRDDMILISFSALRTKMKNSERSLMEKIVEDDKVVSAYLAGMFGLYASEDIPSDIDEFEKSDIGVVVNDRQQLVSAITAAIMELTPTIILDISYYNGDIYEDFEKAIVLAEKTAAGAYGLRSMIHYWEHGLYGITGESINLVIEYLYTEEQFEQVLLTAEDILERIIASEMTDYQKVFAVHEYVINNTQRAPGGWFPENEPYTAFGALVEGEALSQGYSEAVNMLLNHAGIYSTVVFGRASPFTDWMEHAWNIVKIEGSYYHIDTTFNDPVVEDGRQILQYNYLNVTDSDISTDHDWDRNKYPICNNVEFNYYHVNGLVVEDKAQFVDRLTEAIDKNEKEILLKVMDYCEEDYMDVFNIIIGTNKVDSYRMEHNYGMGVIWIYDLEYSS